MISGEQRPRAAEPGGDLVEDQQHVVGQRDLPQHMQVARVVKAHPASTLHDGLDDHRSQLIRVASHRIGQQLHIIRIQLDGRGRHEHLLCQHR